MKRGSIQFVFMRNVRFSDSSASNASQGKREAEYCAACRIGHRPHWPVMRVDDGARDGFLSSTSLTDCALAAIIGSM